MVRKRKFGCWEAALGRVFIKQVFFALGWLGLRKTEQLVFLLKNLNFLKLCFSWTRFYSEKSWALSVAEARLYTVVWKTAARERITNKVSLMCQIAKTGKQNSECGSQVKHHRQHMSVPHRSCLVRKVQSQSWCFFYFWGKLLSLNTKIWEKPGEENLPQRLFTQCSNGILTKNFIWLRHRVCAKVIKM